MNKTSFRNMKRHLALFISAVFIPLLLFSCKDMVFSPEGENFVDIKVNPVPMSIDLDKASDTLWVSGMVDFTYTVNTNGKNFSKLEIFLDTTHLSTSYDQRRFSNFNSEACSYGPHKLRMELWAHSGTGSLGDALGREFLVSRYEWDIFIDNRILTTPLEIESIGPKDGSLEVKWQKFPYRNFVKYEIMKVSLSSPQDQSDAYKNVATITDPNVTSYIDNDYIGGTCKYYVIVSSSKNKLTGPSFMFTDRTAEIVSVTPLDERRIRVVWHKQKYYANFKQYRLYRQDGDAWQQANQISSFSNLQDTSYIDDAGFGKPVIYSVWSLGNGYSTVKSPGVSAQTGTPGLPGNISSVRYIQALNSYYLNNNIRVDASSMKVMAQKTGKYWISSSGKVAVTNESFGTSDNGAPHAFTMVNPLSLEPISQTRYTNDIMGYYSVNSSMAVSETGLCLYAGYRYDGVSTIWGPPVTVLINLNPFSLIKKDSTIKVYFFGQDEMSKLTDEGEYILNAGLQMMNIKNGKFIWMYNTDLQYTSPGNAFMPSGKEFIEVTPGSASVRRCYDYSLVRSFPVESDTYGGMLDPVTGYLGVQTRDSRFLIYDTTTGRVIKELLVFGGSVVYFGNSTLFSRNGYYIKLNYN